MKTLIALSVIAFLLLSAAASLAHYNEAESISVWSNWMKGVSAIWQPFLFAYFIVGFGAWTLHRLYQKEE